MSDESSYEKDIALLTGDKPEVPEKVEVTPEPGKAEGVATPEKADIFDPESLPPVAKAQWETTQKRLAEIEERNKRLDTENRSFRGKTPHLESKVARLERELRERAPPAQVRDVKPTTAKPVDGKAPATLVSLPGYQNLKKVFGDDAAPIEEAFTALESHNQALAERLAQTEARLLKLDELLEKDVRPRIQTIDELRDYRANEQYEHATQEVLKAREDWSTKYPNYRSHIYHETDDNNEVIQTHVSDEMKAWLDDQPDAIANLFAPDATTKEVNRGLGLFYSEVVNKTTQEQQPNPALQVQQDRKEQLTRRAVPSINGDGSVRGDASKLSPQEQYALDIQRLTA
jgi:hypothetical protein